MSKERNGIKVACTLVGTLAIRGRLLKQLAALKTAGISTKLYYGDIGEVPLKREDFDFPIEVISTPLKKSKAVLFLRQMRYGLQAGRRIAESDATHVICFALESLLAGVVAKRRRPELKLIFDSSELHVEAYINPVKKRVWAMIQKYCVPFCDIIMHAEENRMSYFKEHHDPAPDKRVHFLLENLPYFIPGEKLREKPAKPPLRVLYVGVMGPDRFTPQLVDIFRELGPDYTLDLVGPVMPQSFAGDLEKKMSEVDTPNVTVRPAIPHKEMSNLIQDFHVGIALYRNDNLCNYYCAPNKVYDYLMNGVAVIANDYPGLRKVLEVGEVGACVENVDLHCFKAALELIASEQRSNNITDDVRKRYSWEAQNPGYIALFD